MGRKRTPWHLPLKNELFSKNNQCCYCGAEMSLHPCDTRAATIEHIVPLSRGGKDNRSNITLACKPCNQARGNGVMPTGANEL